MIISYPYKFVRLLEFYMEQCGDGTLGNIVIIGSVIPI